MKGGGHGGYSITLTDKQNTKLGELMTKPGETTLDGGFHL